MREPRPDVAPRWMDRSMDDPRREGGRDRFDHHKSRKEGKKVKKERDILFFFCVFFDEDTTRRRNVYLCFFRPGYCTMGAAWGGPF